MKKTEKPIDAELRFMLWGNVFETVRLAIKWTGIAGVAYVGYLCIYELAGQTTVASFVFDLFKAEPPARTTVWMFVASLCAIWAWVERMLRHRKVRYLSARVQELEKRLDPNRTTSGLDPSGKTHPTDKLP